MRADLHAHTIYSDGSDMPEVVLEKAVEIGIDYLAFTDHDTTKWLSDEGVQIQQKAKDMGICLLRGLELSTKEQESGTSAHILGFWPGDKVHEAPQTERLCHQVGEERTQRSLEQAQRIREMGYAISDVEIRGICKADQIFKHDVLKTMFSKGYIEEVMGEFYRAHFQKGQDCYISHTYISAMEAVQAITADGGYAVLAHPGQQDNLWMLPQLKKAGLWGVELYHPMHEPSYELQVRQKAKEYSLYMTGGSDYHGTHHKSRSLGQCILLDDEIHLLQEAKLLSF